MFCGKFVSSKIVGRFLNSSVYIVHMRKTPQQLAMHNQVTVIIVSRDNISQFTVARVVR
jgi:hypothetical protein